MSELAAQHLVSGGVERVLVANRTHDRAVVLAQKFQGEAVPFGEMDAGIRRVDIVISATDSPHYLLRHEQVARIMKERRQKPIFFIDIADPRNIEPKVGEIENVYLYNIDDLQNVANENIKDREKEARKAEAIIEEEMIKFVQWYRSLEVTPTIVALRRKFEDIRKRELEKTFSHLPDLTEKERKSLEALTAAIINKILHAPVTCLKRSNGEASSDLYLDALRSLFQLSEGVSPPSDEEEEGERSGPNELL
jgi:glutamyl-tRNA reductase